MCLLKTFLLLISLWRPAFCKSTTFVRVKNHALASICSIGRHTISNIIIWLDKDQSDFTADYRLYNKYKWNVDDLFNPLLDKTLEYFENDYIVIGADDTRIRKSGKKIPGTSWGRDPLSPPFQVNLVWGLRFLQFSCLLPLYKMSSVAARAIPIRFIHAPPIKKPGKKASEEAWKAYNEIIKTNNLSTTFVQSVRALRDYLNINKITKKILMVCDGSFCNKICMGMEIPGVEIIARARKNSKLCFKNSCSGRKFYGEKKFTPEDVRKDDSIKWKKGRFHYGGEWREMRYKVIDKVLWQSGTKRKFLRLIVLAPLPYVKGGVRNYRQPAYLLCTALDAPVGFLLQSYLDRWQIEVNFKEEKSVLGIGEAQVWNEEAVERQPAFRVAAYSALILASVIAYNDQSFEKDIPKWREKQQRNTIRALIGELRSVWVDDDNYEELKDMGLDVTNIASVFQKAA